MPGPKSGVHGLICVVREGVANTKVVLQTRVVFRLWWLTQLLFLGSGGIGRRRLPGSLPAALRLVDGFSPLLGFLRVLPACPLWSLFPVVLAALLVFFLLAFSLVPWPPVCPAFWLGGSVVGGLASLVPAGRDGSPHCLRIRAVFAAFSELRGARQVERFAE